MPPAVLADAGIQPPPMSTGGGGGAIDSSGNNSVQATTATAAGEGNGLVAKTKAAAASATMALVGGREKSQQQQQQQLQQQPEQVRKIKRDKQSLDYIVRSGIAGGLAGCAAKTVVGPLDRVKILFQASSPQFAKYSGSWAGLFTALREINRSEGARGLFRGHSATLVRVFPYAGIKFLAYEQARAIIIPDRNHETPLRRLASGSIAGLIGTFFTYPLEMIRVRLAFETKKDSRSSYARICRQIYSEAAPTAAPSTRSSSAVPAAATSSGAAAQSAVSATADAVNAVAPRGGIANFYRGFAPTMLGILPYAGISFLTHDVMGDLLRHPSLTRWTAVRKGGEEQTGKDGRVLLTHGAELVSGAVSSMVGQTSAYPLEIIRRRMQVGGAIGDGHKMRIMETAGRIWVEKGWRGFFVGLGIGYTKVVPMGAVSFWAYEIFKRWLGV